MINPWEWLQAWCHADDRRHARFEVDGVTRLPQVTLTFRRASSSFSDSVTASATAFDAAVLDARALLPDEVRR